MQTILQDLRFALRQLRRSPAFALTAILTLALGIGANTAIFSLIDQALLKSLPVRDPDSLVVLEGTGKAWEGSASSHGGDAEAYFSYPMYKDLRDKNKVFEGLLATSPVAISITRNGDSQMTDSEIVSGNYFDLLGVQPALGRLFTQADDQQKDGNPVAVLSFDFWKNHLGSDPSLVGANVILNGQAYQVLGVAAPRFSSAVWGQTPGIFVPMSMLDQIVPNRASRDRLNSHTSKWMNIIGRLKPGVTRPQSEAAMNPLWHALRAEELKALGTKSKRFTDDYLVNSRMLVLPGRSGFSYSRSDYQTPLLAIMGMAVLVLLIASVNVASLLLVRSASRIREFSLRYALGAGGSRIVQQLLLEGLLIGILGGLAGLALAPIAIRELVHLLASDNGSVAFNATIDSRLLLFNFAIAIVVAILFSLAPTLQLRRPDLTSAMGQRSGTGTGAMLSFRRAVVGLQIGLSVLLLIGAGLFVRTMQNLRSVNVGFTTTHLITFGTNPLLAGYTPATVIGLHQQILDRLAALPGVQSAGMTDDPELSGNDHGSNFTVSGYNPPPDEEYDVEDTSISPAYLSTMQVPLLAGRVFSDGDTLEHPLVALVNETFAKHYCGTARECIGRRVGNGGGKDTKLDTEIVGVMHDTKHAGLRDEIRPALFRPWKQMSASAQPFQYFYLRTTTDPAQELPTIRRTMQQVDPKLVLVNLRTMQAQIEDSLSNERMVTLLAIAFGVLATLLAGVGLYGVLAYSTAQRTREIGIRIALGSSRTAISRIVLGDVLQLAGVGMLVALPVAWLLSRLLRTQLYGVSGADPVTMISVVVLISVVAILAALVPAGRAASINPTEALRSE